MELTVEQKNEVDILNTFTRVLGFELPERMLLRLYFALPAYTERKGDFDLSDAACAVRIADKILKEKE